MNRKHMKDRAMLALLLVVMVLPVTAGNIDRQVPVNRSSSAAKTDLSYKNAVLARNTTAKPDVTAVATTQPKEQKKHDKRAIGRCWSRLMETFREINLAHRNRTK